MTARRTALGGLLICLLTTGCAKPPDQVRIRAAIDAMVEAVEQKQTGELMDHVATDFAGSGDVPGRSDVERLLLFHQLRNKNIGVNLRSVNVEVRGDRATASFNALLTGSENWLPERGRDYAFVTGWRLEAGDWKLVNAQWE